MEQMSMLQWIEYGIFQIGFLIIIHCDIVGWPNFVMRMLAARAYGSS